MRAATDTPLHPQEWRECGWEYPWSDAHRLAGLCRPVWLSEHEGPDCSPVPAQVEECCVDLLAEAAARALVALGRCA